MYSAAFFIKDVRALYPHRTASGAKEKPLPAGACESLLVEEAESG